MQDKKDQAKELLKKVKDINSLEEDPRISKEERSAIDFISDAQWDLLKGMRTGVHCKQEFNCLGIQIFLRPLAQGEIKQILNDLLKDGLIPGTTGIWEMEYTNKTLSLASTKHPNLKDEPILSLATLEAMPKFLVDEISRAYIDYIKALEAPIDTLNERQVKEYINVLEKKPHLLSDLPYTHKEQITTYLIKQLKTLMQHTDNLITQS